MAAWHPGKILVSLGQILVRESHQQVLTPTAGVWGLAAFCWLKDSNKPWKPPLLQVFFSSHTHLGFPNFWAIWVGIHFLSLFLWHVKHSSWGALDLTCLCSLCFVTVLALVAEVQNCSPLSGFDLLVFVSALPGAGWNLLQKGRSAEWSIFHWFLSLTASGKYWHSFKKAHSRGHLSLPWKFRLTARFKERGFNWLEPSNLFQADWWGSLLEVEGQILCV